MTVKRGILLFFLTNLLPTSVSGQPSSITARLGHPELIIHNAKIVTMDDLSFGSNVGTIVQAMAVRGDKILATGSNTEMLALAGEETRRIDLKGRTVLPTFSMTHEHPTDWAFQEPEALRHVLGSDDNDVMVMRWMDNRPADEQFGLFGQVLADALSKAKPGQWVFLSFNMGPEYEHAIDISRRFPQVISKALLDDLAPNNPVKVRNGFITSVINTRAMEELKKIHPTLENCVMGGPNTPEELARFERTGYAFSRPVEPDVIFQGKTDLLAEVLKAEMEIWAAWGITNYGSSPYAIHNLEAISLLDRKGEMPARFAWGYQGPDFSIDTLRHIAALLGHGTDHLWNIGAWGQAGGSCTTIEARDEVKQKESCSLAPGTLGREVLDQILRSGGRVATMHTGGDQDIDYFMDAIEQVSKEAGISLSEIRSKRHAFDHASGAPRDDQIPRVKNLGMMVSMINTVLWEDRTDYDISFRVRNYGLEYANWTVPRKSVTDAGIMNTFEIDRPMPHKVFFFINKGITRYHDRDKRVYGARERTDRFIQLKALTSWASYYLLREDLLGTLEAGKYADFLVLDRDYLTVPEEEIPQLKVLMTVVGGRTVHLREALAGEIGMHAVGPATWPSKPLETLYAGP